MSVSFTEAILEFVTPWYFVLQPVAVNYNCQLYCLQICSLVVSGRSHWTASVKIVVIVVDSLLFSVLRIASPFNDKYNAMHQLWCWQQKLRGNGYLVNRFPTDWSFFNILPESLHKRSHSWKLLELPADAVYKFSSNSWRPKQKSRINGLSILLIRV